MRTVSEIKRTLFEKKKKSQFYKMFTNQEMVGCGAQGQVYRALYYGKPVAIKFIKQQYTKGQYIRYIQSQIQNLEGVVDQNILDFIDSYKIVSNDQQKVLNYCIVTEYCEQKLSYNILCNLNDLDKLKICQQIVSGIKVAHDHNVMHRDIKPQNILIKDKKSMTVKIADFGCSRIQDKNEINMTAHIGTPLYSDPNLKTGQYTMKCDVFSLGLVIMQVFCGKNIFSHCQTREDLKDAQKCFFKDIKKYVSQFLNNYSLSQTIRQFLIQTTTFTMAKQQSNRYNSLTLLQFIQDQISRLQNSEEIFSSIPASSELLQTPKPKMTKGDRKVQQVSQLYDSRKQQQQEKITQEVTQIGTPYSNKDDSLYQTKKMSISQDKLKSTQGVSSDQTSQKKQSIHDITSSTHINSFQRQSDIQNQFSQWKQIDSPTKHSKKQNFNARNKFKLASNLKVNSSIIQAQPKDRLDEWQIQQKKKAQQKRRMKIEQNQKKLSEQQKVYSQYIRRDYQIQNLNYQNQSCQKLFSYIKNYKQRFQTILIVVNINSLNYYQKQIIAFLFHYLYASKMEDLIKFAEGNKSSVFNISAQKVSERTKDIVYQLANIQLNRIKPELVRFSSDLGRKLDLIKPRLSDCISNCVVDIRFSQRVLNIRFKQNVIKNQARQYIQQRIFSARSKDDAAMLDRLIDALNCMD